MNRKDALDELSNPAYDQDEMKKDFDFVSRKLGLTNKELQILMDKENLSYKDYRNNMFFINIATKIYTLFKGNYQIFK